MEFENPGAARLLPPNLLLCCSTHNNPLKLISTKPECVSKMEAMSQISK
jgi:hypothetical protein